MSVIWGVGLLLAAASGSGELGRFDPFVGPRPVLVWIQTDVWAPVIGADTPMVSLYEDGTLICVVRGGDNAGTPVRKQMPQKDRDDTLRILRSLGPLSEIKRTYDLAPGLTDQPSTRFYLDLGGGPPIATEVYGLSIKGTNARASVRPTADVLPASLAELHKYLVSMPCEGVPWVPEYIEVMLWPYEYAPEKSIRWPADWPGLDSPRALRRRNSYSIYLPGTSLQRLQEFLKTRKERGAVEVGKKKWAASYRYVFPSEPVWLRAFRQPALQRALYWPLPKQGR
jgi:hypothetical protein